MKIAIAQLWVTPGQPKANFERMVRLIQQAKADHADLIVFPEMAVGGYVLSDLWLDLDWQRELLSFNEVIKNLSDGIGIIWGNLAGAPSSCSMTKGNDGRPLRFNAAFFAYDQHWVKRPSGTYDGLYVKHLLPNYRVFDDSRYFHSARDLPLTHTNPSAFLEPFEWTVHGVTHRIGIEICEDLWSDDYTLNVTQEYKKQGAELIINISSSPWTLWKEKARHRYLKTHATLPLLYVNAVGVQNNGKNVLMFDGGSSVYSADGECLVTANEEGREELLMTDLVTPHLTPAPHNKLLTLLVMAIREFDRQQFKGHVKWIIGLSGGIDSSVNAALLVAALGAERVVGYNLASRYNSGTTISNARLLAQRLKIRFQENSIEPLVTPMTEHLQNGFGYTQIPTLVLENLQARTRGLLLTTFAQLEGGVVCNNGNKLETALGYCTLYGDTIGALSPLGDLTKIQIGQLAEALNTYFGQEIIPTNLIPTLHDHGISWVTPPTAELKSNQIDPMKWGYHDWLLNYYLTFPQRRIEELMDAYLQGQLPEEITHYLKFYGLDIPSQFIEDLEWFLRLIELSVFKRIQMPPIIVASRGAYGYDYRESQLRVESTKRYEELRAAILRLPHYTPAN